MKTVWIVVLVTLLGYLTYQVFAPFIAPLAWAVVLAIMFHAAHQGILRRLRRPNLAALVSTLIITLVLIVPAVLVGTAFVRQAVEAATDIQAQWEQGRMPFQSVLQMPVLDTLSQWLADRGITQQEIRSWAQENIQAFAQFLARQMGQVARNVLVFFFHLFVTLFATFYLLRDGHRLVERIRKLLPLEDTQTEGLFYVAHNVLYASVVSSFVVAAVQGALGGLLFWALGIGKPLLWGVVMGFLSLLPLLGAWLVWTPAAIYLVYNGAYLKAIVLVAIGAGIISSVDNLLRPYLISGRVQLNGLLIFISLLGGIAAFGMIGMILGPILVALGEAVLEFFANRESLEQALAPASTDSA